MNDQWPPEAPEVNKAFKKTHDNTKDEVPPTVLPMITKQQIEEMERQRKKPAAQLNLTPPGIKTNAAADQAWEKQIEKMKERMRNRKEMMRDDFKRSKER